MAHPPAEPTEPPRPNAQDDPSRAVERSLTEASAEGWKLLHDTFKHLTTLSTGSILLMTTLIEQLFPNPEGRVLVPVAFACFLVSTLTALALMILIGDQLRGRAFYENLPHYFWTRDLFLRFYTAELRFGAVLVVICIPAFLLGIGTLVVFTLINYK